MELETLRDLYVHELKDLYSAENQLIKALPKMAKAATNRQLSAAFNQHLEQTKRQAKRLEQILKSHDESTRAPKCEGMEGLIAEGDKMAKEDAEDEGRDAGVIAAAQRVEHYEIAGYGCARTYAQLLAGEDQFFHRCVIRRIIAPFACLGTCEVAAWSRAQRFSEVLCTNWIASRNCKGAAMVAKDSAEPPVPRISTVP